jgi:para-nitrobenzyl esterase
MRRGCSELTVACVALLLASGSVGCSSSPAAPLPDALLDGQRPPDGAPPKTEGSTTREVRPPDGPAAPACPNLPAADKADLVKTTHATLRGKLDGDTWGFTRIRYAAPPVGALRFARPTPPACEAAVVDATVDPSSCPQVNPIGGAVMGEEDCLFLNVWVPPHASSTRLPVLFFIHGGGNYIGSSIWGADLSPGGQLARMYEGGPLARGAGAVVVTTNYRLGALGFLAHPALRTADGGSGNWATHDQLAALGWVHDNIAAFGGDPSRVTIVGESAGGLNVCTLVASPLASGLFQGAIVESGGCDVPTRDLREKDGQTTAAAVSCGSSVADPAACLRAASVESLVKAAFIAAPTVHNWYLPYGPNVDGVTLTGAPLTVIGQGKHNAVPLIVGTNLQEWASFAVGTVILTCAAYEAELAKEFPGVSDKVLAKYPCKPFAPRDTFIAAVTAGRFTCEARRLARATRTGQSQGVWRYHFRDGMNTGLFAALGAGHVVELFYLFDSFGSVLCAPSAAESAIGAFLRTSWGSLAATGSPNPAGKTDWPAYDKTTDNVITIDEQLFQMKLGTDTNIVPECDFWDGLVAASP